MTAEELLAAATECVTCGKQHTQTLLPGNQVTWASPTDGHPLRTRIYAMTGDSSDKALNALRHLAGLDQGT